MRYILNALLVLLLPFYPLAASADEIAHDDTYQIINDYRAQFGGAPLSPHPSLERAAQAKLDDMIAQNYWGHFGPDNEAPWDVIAEHDYRVLHAGENLAMGYKDEVSLVHGWISSAPHRDNMLADYEHIGIATQKATIGHRNGILVVAMFATPKPYSGANIGFWERTLTFSRNVILARPTHQLAHVSPTL